MLNWMDRDLADFRSRHGDAPDHVVWARCCGTANAYRARDADFRGVVDLIAMKAYFYSPDGSGVSKVEEIPQALARRREACARSVGRTGRRRQRRTHAGIFRRRHSAGRGLVKGLREAVASRRIYPVLLSSALHNVGSDALLNFLAEIFPCPCGRGKARCHKTADHSGDAAKRGISEQRSRSPFSFSKRLPIHLPDASPISKLCPAC